MNAKKNLPLLSLISSMFIFGTIGIFVRFLPFSSSFIAMCRGYIGFIFIILFMLISKTKADFGVIKRNLTLLCISGIFIGFNWIFLFEAYKYTTVARATLCYYLQPVFVMLLSPVFVREKLTVKKLVCVLCALAGMFFVSGAAKGSGVNSAEIPGFVLGVGAAVLYALVILINKRMKNIGQYETTSMQLFVAALSVTPYTLFTDSMAYAFSPKNVLLLLLVGIVHTGFAYTLYFSSMKKLKAQTVAILSYTDPVVAIILSSIIFSENMGFDGFVGAVLILGAAFVSEFFEKSK